jgi:hypothetical protein
MQKKQVPGGGQTSACVSAGNLWEYKFLYAVPSYTIYSLPCVQGNYWSFGFGFQPIEVAVGVAGSEGHKRSVYLDVERGWRPPFGIGPIQLPRVGLFKRSRIMYQAPRLRENEDAYGECPKKRGDGWLEIELGEFFNGGEDDREVEMSVLEVNGNWKGDLIVQGIEIRPKE